MIHIDEDLGIEWRDAGPWRSYHLTASGNNEEELFEDATIEEVDQDGGTLDCYGYNDCSGKLEEAVEEAIYKALKRNEEKLKGDE
jgi:hypothetical protein